MIPEFSWTSPAAWTGILLPILFAVLSLALGWLLARPAQRAIVTWLPRTGRPAFNTLAPLAGQAVRYGIVIFAVVTALGFLGVPSASILTVVGTASLAIALALQNTLSNVAAGIMLTWIRPIAVGDYITGDGVEGVVVEVGLFGTRLRSTSGLFVFTNNNKLWNGAITNHSREPRRRIDVNVTMPDTADLGQTRRALLDIAMNDRRVLSDPAPVVIVNSFSTNTVSLQMRAWVATPDYPSTLRDLTEAAKLGVNRLLADGQVAEIAEAADPHVAHNAAPTPNLS
jgi:small conductance mechanosensitive channel